MAKPQYLKEAIGFNDINLLPNFSNVTSRRELNTNSYLARNLELEYPIVLSPMDTISSIESCCAMNEIGAAGILHRFMLEENRLNSAIEIKRATGKSYVAIGLGDNEIFLDELVFNASVDLLFLDVAHGSLKSVVDFIKKLNSKYKNHVRIVTGNTLTMESVSSHILSGSDGVRHGIGIGGACLTTEMTGVGCPALTANYYAWKALKNIARDINSDSENSMLPTILTDGGIRKPSDLVKAIVSGADAVICGRIFAGCKETPGEILYETDKGDLYTEEEIEFRRSNYNSEFLFTDRTFKRYRGMASEEVQDEYSKYEDIKDKFVEGAAYEVPYHGKSVKDIVYEYVNGLKSAMSYFGIESLEELKGALWDDRVIGVRVSPNATYEGSSHGNNLNI